MPAFHFHHPIEIRYSDLDPQGHVNNARFLTYFEQARVNYLINLGLFSKEQSFLEIGIILAEATVTFKAPVYFSSAPRVGVRVSRLGNKSLTMEYEMAEANGTVYATGATVIVTYDYSTQATVPIPATWRAAIERQEKFFNKDLP
jgi:acyl-CoA thioester hydrolase